MRAPILALLFCCSFPETFFFFSAGLGKRSPCCFLLVLTVWNFLPPDTCPLSCLAEIIVVVGETRVGRSELHCMRSMRANFIFTGRKEGGRRGLAKKALKTNSWKSIAGLLPREWQNVKWHYATLWYGISETFSLTWSILPCVKRIFSAFFDKKLY